MTRTPASSIEPFRPAHRGFTLLEVLAATAMAAVLAGSLFASLHIAFKARDTAYRSVETIRRFDAAFGLIQEDLQSAAGPNGVLAGPFVGVSGLGGLANRDASGLGTPFGGQAAFGGQGDSLSFFAAATDVQADTGVGDIKKVEFLCQPEQTGGGTGVTLIRRLTTNLLSPLAVEPTDETICRGIGAFTLRYFDGTNWQDSWDSTTLGNILPMAVEVTIALNESAGLPDGDQPGQPGPGSRMTRVLLIPCGRPAPAASGASTAAP